MFNHTRFLIIRLSSIGDVLHCTPVARVLKTAFPSCHITWMVGQGPSSLLHFNPYIDEVYVWPRERWEQHMRQGQFSAAWQLWNKMKLDLRAKHFDIVLDIHGLFLSGMIAAASKTPRRIGMSNTQEFNWLFMSETAPAAPQDVHVIQRYLSILRPLGIASAHYAMTLHLPDEAIAFAKEFLKSKGVKPRDTLIALNPATTWPAKNWPASHYASLAKALQGNAHILLCGSPSDQELGNHIIRESEVPVLNSIGQTSLLQLAALISHCNVLVTGDTGPLHMAIALGIPTVSMFGPTDPKKFGPLTPGHIVLEEQMDCRPCHKKQCPLTHLNCMHFLSPDRVAASVKIILAKQNINYSSVSKKEFPYTF